MKTACDERGMTHLIHADSATVLESVKRSISGQYDAKRDFDPLVTATMMIYSRAVQVFGLAIGKVPDDGCELCPICEVIKVPSPTMTPEQLDNHWTVTIFDTVLEGARNEGVMPKVQ